MTKFLKISLETKKELVKMTIFLLIQAFILLFAIGSVFFYIAVPLIKNSWNTIISNYIHELNGKYSGQLQTFGQSSSALSSNAAMTDDEKVLAYNNDIRNQAFKTSFITSGVVFLLALVITYFSSHKYSKVLGHSIAGFGIVAICYSLFSIFYIERYETLNPDKAIKQVLISAHNTMNPNDTISIAGYQQ